MRGSSGRVSRAHSIGCPACEPGKLQTCDPVPSRCDSCGRVLAGAILETLRQIVALPDAVGTHACECGHPEMRKLPDRVFHCPACGSEVVPPGSARPSGKAAGLPGRLVDRRFGEAGA
jgi:ribosomal protein L37AE/L43A